MGIPFAQINDRLEMGFEEFPGWDTGYLSAALIPTGPGAPAQAQEPVQQEEPLDQEEEQKSDRPRDAEGRWLPGPSGSSLPSSASPDRGWVQDLSPSESEAIHKWGYGYHVVIRDYQKGGSSHPEAESVTREFESALDKCPRHEGTVYRGIGFRSDESQREFLSSSEFSFEAVSSCSKGVGPAAEFMDVYPRSTLLELKSSSCADISGFGEVFEEDSEVIARKGTSYRITGVREESIETSQGFKTVKVVSAEEV
jgi:hypothetical protein